MKKFEITEEQIKQAYDAACEDWKQRIKEWFPEWNKRQSGWYYNNTKNVLSYYDFENKTQYGFNAAGGWYNVNNVKLSGTEYPAPEKEVEERLIEEAKRRGYKEGISVVDVIDKERVKILHDDFRFFIKDMATNKNATTLMMGYQRVVFNDGKWAEIISTPEPDEYITLNNIKYKRCN